MLPHSVRCVEGGADKMYPVRYVTARIRSMERVHFVRFADKMYPVLKYLIRNVILRICTNLVDINGYQMF